MNFESQRTAIFAVIAAISVVAARFAGPSIPKSSVEVSDIGEAFYPTFTDASAAKSLEVVSYNADTATVRPFAIVQDKSGLWRIPYAHNYPADGKERLAKTATSMIGIKREGLVGRRETEHAEFGVLDPLRPESAKDLKGIGDRITLKDADGKVLADYIIGKEVAGRTGQRYVRLPDENPTYIAKIDIQVSTKFADWIESDLLKIEAARLNTIAIDTTTIDADKRAIIDGELNRLTRKNSTDPWTFDGLDESKEETNQPEVTKLVSALDELKIVGVRRKPARLMQGLRDDKGLQLDQVTVLDLDTKGFFLVKTPKGFTLIPKDGGVIAVTDQGVAYDLKFGEIFSGSEEEVEVGFASKEGTANDKKDDKAGDAKDADGKDKKDDAKKDDKPKQKSRYLFVTAQFDPDGLGPRPTAPDKPAPPSDQPSDPEAPADAGTPANTAPDPQKVYEAALAKFEQDQKSYVDSLKAYEEKIAAGEKLVKELNVRFADWYYVVSGDSFENLRQGRQTLVKEKSATPPGGNPPGVPGLPGLPGGIPQGIFPPGN